MNIPLSKIDLLDEDIQRVASVLKSGWIMQGPQVEAFEKKVAKFCGVPHAVATSSGTTALHLALEIIGIRSGDEVIVPSFSWIASANAIRYCGATPVFCDVDPITYNMDPNSVATLVTQHTRAIMAVHQFGMPCDLQAMATIAQKHNLEIIEDAACAIGSLYQSEPIGNCRYARVACFSFHPRKVVTTGEGGMLVTRDSHLATTARVLRNHGADANSFTHVGYNYRLTDIQAALGIGQITRLKRTINQRRSLAAHYQKLLNGNANIILPCESGGCRTNFQSFMIRLQNGAAKDRDRIADQLTAVGIASRKSISPIHQEPCYIKAHAHVILPRTNQLALDGLVLPLFGSMKEDEVDLVSQHLLDIIEK